MAVFLPPRVLDAEPPIGVVSSSLASPRFSRDLSFAYQFQFSSFLPLRDFMKLYSADCFRSLLCLMVASWHCSSYSEFDNLRSPTVLLKAILPNLIMNCLYIIHIAKKPVDINNLTYGLMSVGNYFGAGSWYYSYCYLMNPSKIGQILK